MLFDSSVIGMVTFAVGLAILWYGLSLLTKSLPLSLIALLGGCAIAVLGAQCVTMLYAAMFQRDDAIRYMALPAAVFIGACLFKFGPDSPSGTTRRRILRSGMAALFVGLFVSGTRSPTGGIIVVLPVLVFWFSLIRYRPAARWGLWLRKMAYTAMLVWAGSAYLMLHTAMSCGRWGCFWTVDLPFGLWVRLPHPYDYYITYQLTRYLTLVSLLSTVVYSVACLCVWALDTLKIKALPAAKPLS